MADRAKLIRHLRPFWDTYRFRIAPQVNDVIVRRIANGTLAIQAASLRTNPTAGDGIAVDLRARRTTRWERRTFDAAVLATGPAQDTVFDGNPLLGQIRDAGLARPDPLGLGIDVDWEGHAIGRDGQATGPLFVVCPLARGTFGELMGAPDIAKYARAVAATIANSTKRAERLPPHPVQA